MIYLAIAIGLMGYEPLYTAENLTKKNNKSEKARLIREEARMGQTYEENIRIFEPLETISDDEKVKLLEELLNKDVRTPNETQWLENYEYELSEQGLGYGASNEYKEYKRLMSIPTVVGSEKEELIKELLKPYQEKNKEADDKIRMSNKLGVIVYRDRQGREGKYTLEYTEPGKLPIINLPRPSEKETLYSALEVEKPSMFRSIVSSIKDWFSQKKEAFKAIDWQQKLQSAREQTRQSMKQVAQKTSASLQKTAERIAQPSPEAQSSFGSTIEGEGSGRIQRYEIVPGSPADKMRQWWNKKR